MEAHRQKTHAAENLLPKGNPPDGQKSHGTVKKQVKDPS